MDVLTKALDSSRAMANFARQAAVKSDGGSDWMVPYQSGFSAFQDAAKYRDRYGAFRGWLFSAVNALAESAAGQGVNLGRVRASPRQDERTGYFMRKATRSIVKLVGRGNVEIVEDDPLLDALDDPNPIQGRWQLVYLFVANLCLTGWSFLVAGADERKIELFSLPTTWIQPDHSDGPFSSFTVSNPKKPAAKREKLDRSQVAFAHLPNPSDPLGALAPSGTQMTAIRIDDHIQTSQEMFFKNGIFPSALVRIGKGPYVDSKGRPMLTASQRREIYSVIAKLMAGVVNYGRPVIIDGLIEGIERFSATANEMGWDKSEDKNRNRILSAYGVHPYILGEVVNVGGYAQAAKIEERFYAKVNTYLDMLGTCLTNYMRLAMDDPGLLIWWDKCEPLDPSLHWQNLREARKNEDITRDEFRAALGYPPAEEEHSKSRLLETVGGMTGANALLQAMGRGEVSRDAVVQLFVEFFGVSEDRAREMTGGESSSMALADMTLAVREAAAAIRVRPSEIASHLLEDLR